MPCEPPSSGTSGPRAPPVPLAGSWVRVSNNLRWFEVAGAEQVSSVVFLTLVDHSGRRRTCTLGGVSERAPDMPEEERERRLESQRRRRS